MEFLKIVISILVCFFIFNCKPIIKEDFGNDIIDYSLDYKYYCLYYKKDKVDWDVKFEYSMAYIHKISNDTKFKNYIDSIISPRKIQYYVNKTEINTIDSIFNLIKSHDIIIDVPCGKYSYINSNKTIEYKSSKWWDLKLITSTFDSCPSLFPASSQEIEITTYRNLVDSLSKIPSEDSTLIITSDRMIPPSPIYKYKILYKDSFIIEKELLNPYYYSILCR